MGHSFVLLRFTYGGLALIQHGTQGGLARDPASVRRYRLSPRAQSRYHVGSWGVSAPHLRSRGLMPLTLPELSLVVLIGPSGSGKSTFARRQFKPTEVLSS